MKLLIQQYSYEVLKDLPVLEGEIAPWFEQPGGGIQYRLAPEFETQIRAEMKQDDTMNGIIQELIKKVI